MSEPGFDLLKDVIFLSSTFRDLVEARKKILLSFQGQKIQVEAMENFGASGKPPLSFCLEKLELCQIYLLVIGDTYGTIDDETRKSITELEYERAIELYSKGKIKDIWIYKPTKNFTSEIKIEQTKEQEEKLEIFKEKVCKKHTVDFYDSFAELNGKIQGQCLRSFVEYATPILMSSGVSSKAIRSVKGISDTQIKFVNEQKPLNLTPLQQSSIEQEINEMNKILKGLGKEALKKHNINVKTVTLIGNYYYTTQQYDKAIEMFDYVLQSFPDDPRALNNKGVSLRLASQREEALELFGRAHELEPNYTDPIVNMSGILCEIGRAKEALPMLEEILKKESEPDFILLLNLGLAHSKMGNFEDAHKYYEDTEKINPSDPQILLNIAILYHMEGKYDKTTEYAEKILQKNPDHVGAIITKGGALLETNQLQLAAYYFEKAVKSNSREVTALVNLCLTCRRLQETGVIKWTADLVEIYSERVLEIQKDEPESLNYLAWVYAQCDKYEKALELNAKSIKNRPKYMGSLMDRVSILQLAEKYQDALDLLNKYMIEDDWTLNFTKYTILKNMKREKDMQIVLDKLNELKPMWQFFMHPLFRALNWFGNDPGLVRGSFFK